MIFWTVVILGGYLVIVLGIGFHSGRGAGKDAESSLRGRTETELAAGIHGRIYHRLLRRCPGGNHGPSLSRRRQHDRLHRRLYLYHAVNLLVRRRAPAASRSSTGIPDAGQFVPGRFLQSEYLRWGAALAGALFSIPYFMVGPVALGILLNQSTGFPYWAGVLLFLHYGGVYTIKGGLRAVAKGTDIFHGVLLLMFFVGALVVLALHAGGFAKHPGFIESDCGNCGTRPGPVLRLDALYGARNVLLA